MEDPAVEDQHQMNAFGYSSTEPGIDQFISFSPVSDYSSYQIQNVGHSQNAPFATECENPQLEPPPSNSQIISFQNSDLSPDFSQQYLGTYELQDFGEGMKMKGSGGSSFRRTGLHAQEHVIAERKRREKLNERFIALSATIPGLAKMDKLSILGGTIKYLKKLEERIKVLEEELATRTMESVVFMKKSHQRGDGVVSFSSEENLYNPIIQRQLPEVDVRALGKNILIKVQCKKREGCITDVMKQMENMNLTTLNISVLAFGSSLLDVTIVAQIDNENCPTIHEIVGKLRRALTLLDHLQDSQLVRQ